MSLVKVMQKLHEPPACFREIRCSFSPGFGFESLVRPGAEQPESGTQIEKACLS